MVVLGLGGGGGKKGILSTVRRGVFLYGDGVNGILIADRLFS